MVFISFTSVARDALLEGAIVANIEKSIVQLKLYSILQTHFKFILKSNRMIYRCVGEQTKMKLYSDIVFVADSSSSSWWSYVGIMILLLFALFILQNRIPFEISNSVIFRFRCAPPSFWKNYCCYFFVSECRFLFYYYFVWFIAANKVI